MQSIEKEEINKIFSTLISELIESVIDNEISDQWIDTINPSENTFINNVLSQTNHKNHFEIPEKGFFQIKIHQQFIFNLCGYHVLFSFFNLVNFISSGFQSYLDNLNSSKIFWIFHNRIRKFLYKYSIDKNLIQAKGLWSKQWCLHGDMERSHLKAIMYENPEFFSTFNSNQFLEVSHCVLEFQFDRFVTDIDQLVEIQLKIDKFRKDDQFEKGKTFCVFIGACNHWIGFMANKKMLQSEYLLIDSRNKNYLVWTAEEINSEIDKINEQKIKDKLEPWDKFKIMVNTQCVFDIQLITSLLLDVFEGNSKLGDHFYCKGFKSMYDRFYHKCFNDLKIMTESTKMHDKSTFHSKVCENYHYFKQAMNESRKIIMKRDFISLFYRVQFSDIFYKLKNVILAIKNALKNDDWAYRFINDADFCMKNIDKILIM